MSSSPALGQTRTSALVTVRSALHPVNGHRREQATKAGRRRGPPSHADMAKFYRSRADVRKAKKKQLIAYQPVNLALARLKDGIKVAFAT